MIDQSTIESAKKWCLTGQDWIGKGAVNLGMNYLNKSIPVFQEAADPHWHTYALHHKLRGYKIKHQDDMVENLFEDVMGGYVVLGDTYGQALLLVHLAECIARQRREERALSTLNIALNLSEQNGLRELAAFALLQQAALYVQRKNHMRAVRLLRPAEQHYDAVSLDRAVIGVRQLLADSLIEMGELGEAIALLEDVQSRLWNREDFRDAVRPLKQLVTLYGETGISEDQARVAQMLHWSGQQLIRGDAEKSVDFHVEPPIELDDSTSVAGESSPAEPTDADGLPDSGDE